MEQLLAVASQREGMKSYNQERFWIGAATSHGL
jgi:hypothetical protein